MAEDAKQAPDMDKGPNPIQTSDLETPASKRKESWMTEKDPGPEDKLIAEVGPSCWSIMLFCNLVQDNRIS